MARQHSTGWICFAALEVTSGASFDYWQDLENSAGSWDLYGTEDERRYPGLQAEFFQRAAAPLRRREALFGFVGVGEHCYGRCCSLCDSLVAFQRQLLCCVLTKGLISGWAAGIALWGANGSKWAKLPIQNGPKKGAVIGPRGRI